MSGHVAGSLDGADDGVLRGDHADTLELDVTGDNTLLDVERGHVDVDIVRKILHQGADLDEPGDEDEFSSLLDSHRVAADSDRNLDGDRLVLRDGEEIDMEAVVLDRMELKLMDDSLIGLTVVELDVDDKGSGGVGDTLEVLVVDSEEDILHSLTIKVARDKTLLADRFDDGFVADLTDFAVDFEMFHCTLFKMCYSTPGGPGPHCTKNASAFLSGGKDRN